MTHQISDQLQYAFRPTGSISAALTALHHMPTTYLAVEPSVALISDFGKAFNTVRHFHAST